MNALIKIALMLFTLNCFSQDVIFEKEVIYFKLKNDKDCLDKYKLHYKEGYDYRNKVRFKLYNSKEKGIVFNLYCEEGKSFLFSFTSKSDTLCLKHLKDYKISTIEEVKQIEKEWRKKNKAKFIEKFGFPYPPYDKNGIFKTFVIEVLEKEEKFVIYPVTWRNLGVVD